MTNEQSETTPVASAPGQSPAAGAASRTDEKKVRLWPLWIFCLLLLVLLLGSGYLGWMQLQKLEKNQPSDLITEAQVSQAVSGGTQPLRNQLQALESQLNQKNAQFDQLQKQIEDATRRLMADDPTGRADWLMAEAEYLLRLANQRLYMERDFQGALIILKAADSVLTELDEPAAFPVRKQLAREITKLEGIAKVDRVGLFLKMEALIEQIESLDQNLFFKDSPLLEQTQAMEPEPMGTAEDATWRDRIDAALERLEKYFVIHRRDEPVEPLMAPDQIYYLQQNLRLMLEQAQLALLDGNQAIFESSLQKAERWIVKYFVAKDPVTKALLSNLSELRGSEIDPELPDISQSLRALKGLMENIYKGKTRLDEEADA